MAQQVLALKEQILKGEQATKAEILEIIDAPIEVLSHAANAIRQHFCGDKVDLCSIVNGKSGVCSENCKYCAQSAHYSGRAEVYELLSEETLVAIAKENYSAGVGRYSIVTSGKRLSKEEVDKVAQIYEAIGRESQISLCASHGLLDEEDLGKLARAGVVRYHNNLETSRSYFPQICTTHTYEDKLETIKSAKAQGFEVCSGGLFGLGETMEDRIDMAIELREIGIKSVPINALVAIEGTPLADRAPLGEEEILRIIALYRFILPDAWIRLAGGRVLLEEGGRRAFEAGANATITGNLLTTCGNTIADDLHMLEQLGLEV